MTNEAKIITLEGMSWVRAFSACQALMLPTRFYGVTHKRAREVLRKELGFCPKGKPGTPDEGKALKGFRSGGGPAIFAWLGIEGIKHHRHTGMAVVPDDRTYLKMKATS